MLARWRELGLFHHNVDGMTRAFGGFGKTTVIYVTSM